MYHYEYLITAIDEDGDIYYPDNLNDAHYLSVYRRPIEPDQNGDRLAEWVHDIPLNIIQKLIRDIS